MHVSPPAPLPEGLDAARRASVACVAWPPATGRTEVVAGLVAEEGSTIVVAPDASRHRCRRHALSARGHVCVVLRANQPDAERTRAWDAARAGVCVVLGARLAVLAPVPDLTAVVVLDDGDEALKEERVPDVERARGRTRAWCPCRRPGHVRLAGAVGGGGPGGRRGAARRTGVSSAPAGPSSRSSTSATRRRGGPSCPMRSPTRPAPRSRGANGWCACSTARVGLASSSAARATSVARCEVCEAAVVEGDAGFECARCARDPARDLPALPRDPVRRPTGRCRRGCATSSAVCSRAPP